jgi:hypothetical protein
MPFDGEQGHGFRIVAGSDDQRGVAAYATQSSIQRSHEWPLDRNLADEL